MFGKTDIDTVKRRALVQQMLEDNAANFLTVSDSGKAFILRDSGCARRGAPDTTAILTFDQSVTIQSQGRVITIEEHEVKDTQNAKVCDKIVNILGDWDSDIVTAVQAGVMYYLS